MSLAKITKITAWGKGLKPCQNRLILTLSVALALSGCPAENTGPNSSTPPPNGPKPIVIEHYWAASNNQLRISIFDPEVGSPQFYQAAAGAKTPTSIQESEFIRANPAPFNTFLESLKPVSSFVLSEDQKQALIVQTQDPNPRPSPVPSGESPPPPPTTPPKPLNTTLYLTKPGAAATKVTQFQGGHRAVHWLANQGFLIHTEYTPGETPVPPEVKVFSPSGKPLGTVKANQLQKDSARSPEIDLVLPDQINQRILYLVSELGAGEKVVFVLYQTNPEGAEPQLIREIGSFPLPAQRKTEVQNPRLTEVALSPDGQRLLLKDSLLHLYAVTVENGPMQYLGGAAQYAWSPNSSQIIFSEILPADSPQLDPQKPPPPADIVVIRPDGSGRNQITKTPELAEGAPLWSSDGKYVSYVIDGLQPPEFLGVYTIKTDASSQINYLWKDLKSSPNASK